jgi:Holliday junction resolvase
MKKSSGVSKIEKIKTVHALKSNFSMGESQLNDLLKQFESKPSSKEIERYFKGFEAEDIFRFIFSVLPWSKLIIQLDQEQLPIYSKENYQVPDFLMYYEDNKLRDNAVLVEVKSVDENRLKLKLMGKQVNALLNFSQCLQVPLVFAIYWKKYSAWVITSIEYFEKRGNRYIIDFEQSFKNDLSIFMSHFSFVVPDNLFIRTIYQENSPFPDAHQNKDYGFIAKEEVSIDNINYVTLKRIESALLYSFLHFKVFSKQKEMDLTIVRKNSSTFIARPSYVMMRFLNSCKLEINAKYSYMAADVLFTLFKKLSLKEFYILPSLCSKTGDEIFSKAFGDDHIYKSYKTRPYSKNSFL